MKTTKLREALSELRAERKALDEAIVTIERLLNRLDSDDQDALKFPHIAAFLTENSAKTYVSLAVQILRSHGKPMSIKDLAFEVSKIKEQSVQRSSIEGTIFKHIQSAKDAARIVKVGPATYALPEWSPTAKITGNA